jgi:phosphoribosylanthranilate isomerase
LLVKICGLRTADDVQAAVNAGVDAIGFVFAESVRRVSPGEASTACGNISPTVRRVAVMRHPSNEEWLKVLDGFRPDVLQTDIEDFEALDVPYSVERWPVIREDKPVLEGTLPATFLYEGAQSGSGQKVEWAQAARVAAKGNMILAGGLSAANVAEAITGVRPSGVDVSSGVEGEPGRKDPVLIQKFVEAARAAEKAL